MRTIAATACSAVAVFAGLAGACSARADARQGPAAPTPKGFDVGWSWEIGSPGSVSTAASVSIAASLSRIFVVDDETGGAAYAVADGLLVWRTPLRSSLAPVVAGDQVFIASGGQLHALDEATGSARWTRDLGGQASALAANGTGALGAAGHVLRAWTADGVPAWQHEFETDVATALIAVDAGLAYVGLADRTLTAVDATSGDVRWRRKLPTVPRAFAASGGRLYFGGADQALYAYTRGGGRPWRFPQVDTLGAPAADDRLVYVVLRDNTARAFDRNSGNRQWRQALPGRPVGGPWVLGGEVIVPLMSGALASLARATGALAPASPPGGADRPRDRLLAATASATGTEVFEVVQLDNNSRVLVARRRAK